jgi:hypothetical protein
VHPTLRIEARFFGASSNVPRSDIPVAAWPAPARRMLLKNFATIQPHSSHPCKSNPLRGEAWAPSTIIKNNESGC